MPAYKPFTEQEKKFILDNFENMTLRGLASAINRSEGGVKTWIRKLGLRRNTRFDWTPERVEIFETMYPNHSSQQIADALDTTAAVINAKSRHSKVRKTPEYLATLNKQMGENLQRNGYATRFEKGHQPWSTGKKIGSHPNSAKSQFKKGQTPHNYQPVGTILPVSLMPYLKIKIADPDKWEFLHRYNWEKIHGEISAGFVIWFKDRDPKNCAVENLELISRKEMRNRTSISSLPPELQDAYRMLGRLTKAIRKKEKEKENAKEQTE